MAGSDKALKHEMWELRQMQSVPLEIKIRMTQTRIRDWYNHWNGKVYVSFSGGKDSTVLLHIARELYSDIEAVFCDTGLEYPEIREFVKTYENVTWLKPLRYDKQKREYIPTNFREVINFYGYPVISKEASQAIWEARKKTCQRSISKFDDNSEYVKKYGKRFSLSKWTFLKDSNIPISHLCCKAMKKTPQNNWTDQDVLLYLKTYKIPYCSVYGDIVNQDRQMKFIEDDSERLITTGCERTGCMFCMFGITRDKAPNRFQRLKMTHPKIYDYCIGGGEYDENGLLKPNKQGLGIGKILDYIGVEY